MSRLQIPVNPEVLKWARERAGFTRSTVHVFPEAELELWETGEARPTLAQARKLAEKYHRTAAFFMLPKPPKEDPLPDFRGDPNAKPNPALQSFIHQVRARCEWAEEMRRASGIEPVARGYIGSGNLKASRKQAAAEILHALSIDISQVWGRKDALNWWIQCIENAGIFVFQNDTGKGKSIDCRSFRGLAIVNSYAPAIGLNSQDALNGRIFTLAHELTHLWLGKEGISTMAPNKNGEMDPVEKFCNSVAAEILMPTDEFQNKWISLQSEGNGLRPALITLSKKFNVSEDAVARKALDCGHIGKATYTKLHQEYLSNLRAKPRGGGPSKKGDKEKRLARQAGRSFSQMLLSAYRAEEVNPTVARKLLNAKRFEQIDAIAEFHGLLA